MKVIAMFLALAITPIDLAAQQRFSCSYGDRGACLSYGETVCSSLGKCVSESAVCFDSYQCNYQGFTCKSNVTACAEEYDGLLTRFNSLVNDYNELLVDSREVRASLDSTLEELGQTQYELEETQQQLWTTRRDFRRLEDAFIDLQACIEGLGSLDDPTLCLP